MSTSPFSPFSPFSFSLLLNCIACPNRTTKLGHRHLSSSTLSSSWLGVFSSKATVSVGRPEAWEGDDARIGRGG
ncbi:hypothetical protein BDZ85DRAFT_267150 [Elsinoe ampelina]|uniref:Uncharacterized protein n=1 Tax=Elsinoe ampelina TaxID=302913 RepID=A0A6A6G2X6_9PEZI|nr:hypothetical protein BDZ85DRAFT_267150 [Elsinoe ampelina]